MATEQQSPEDYVRTYSKIVARAWADEDFKQRFLADPRAVMREFDLDVPEGVELRAVANTDSVVYVALPPPPSEEMSDEDLAHVAGGGDTVGCAATGGTISSGSCPVSTVSTLGTAGTAGTG